jgi:hypothetical protein
MYVLMPWRSEDCYDKVLIKYYCTALYYTTLQLQVYEMVDTVLPIPWPEEIPVMMDFEL